MGERGRRSGVPDLTQHGGVATKVISSGRFWGIGTYPARRAPSRRTPKSPRTKTTEAEDRWLMRKAVSTIKAIRENRPPVLHVV